MKISYQTLCRLKLQHSYYNDSRIDGGLRVWPTPACQDILEHHHILFRQTENGFSLFVKVVPETTPAQLFQQLNSETLKLSFWLEASNPLLLNISALPARHSGQDLLYFDNLTDHRITPVAESLLYLHDTSLNSKPGDVLRLVVNSVYTYRFTTPVTEAVLILKDLFNKTVETITINGSEPISEYRINLADIQAMVPGRYTFMDDQGGSSDIYFYPELMGKPVFGLVDLYNTTKNLTTDNSEQVPEAYHFLSLNNTLTQVSAYTLKFDSQETTWRYIVTKKYANNGIELDQLTVKDSNSMVTFEPEPDADDKHIIFTAQKGLALKETRKPIVLEQKSPSNKIRDLPNPTFSTALQKFSGLTDFSSDIYIYV
ncbi:MAG: hypothetical protein DRQ43_03065 [Gammaproteobacteria bacterium]|nr:MAG: hypothetical protein DRQ43_03065 [Gammaproteobacteria bacterium]